MPTDRIDPPPLAPELADLLQTTERDVLRAIVRDGDIVDGFKARLLSAAHGLPADDEGDDDAWLLVRLSPALMDALAAFEADDADLEAEPDDEEGGDAEPSLGATNAMNQEKAWRSPTEDLEYDGDGVADADLEPNLGATNCGNPIIPQTHWATTAPEECEEENEHAESAGFGDGCVDMEPMLGATEDMNQRWAWIKPGWPYCDDGEATETEDDLPQPERSGLTFEQSQAEEAASRAAVQEALGRLREVTGVRAYAGGGRGVRFYRPDESGMIDGVRIVGILR